jgi:biofilm PGA synthesis N-glycosyltransferase PgaC
MIGIVFWASVALVAYTYAGYPMVLTMAALLVGRDRRYPPFTPTVSIVIAAHNEQDVIAQKIENTLDLDYPRDLVQLIVTDDGSDDATQSIISRYQAKGIISVRHSVRRGKTSAINRAMDRATGEIVLFSDANTQLHRDALAEIVLPFSNPSVGAVAGRKAITGEAGLGVAVRTYWRYENHLRRMETRLGCTVAADGEIFAMRRRLFSPPPATTINDDQWLATEVIRLGHRLVFRPEAVSEEPVPALAAEEAERRTRMVAGQFQAFAGVTRIPWRHPVVAWMLISHKLLRPLVPFGMIGALGAAVIAAVVAPDGGIVALGGGWALAAVGAQALFYALAFLGRHLPGRLGAVAYVPRFLVDSNLAALRGLWRHVRGSQTTTWRQAARSNS